MNPTKIEKRGFRMAISEEFELSMSGFPRKGHYVEIPLTDEDRAAHARAVAAVEEVENNPWVSTGGPDYDNEVRPLEPRTEFVPEETTEEHLARWNAAGRPHFAGDALRTRLFARLGANILPANASFTAVHTLASPA